MPFPLAILPFVFRLLFYSSAVLFVVRCFVNEGPALLVCYLNPICSVITLNRAAVVGGSVPALVVVTALVSPLLFLIPGFVFFKLGEGSYARGCRRRSADSRSAGGAIHDDPG